MNAWNVSSSTINQLMGKRPSSKVGPLVGATDDVESFEANDSDDEASTGINIGSTSGAAQGFWNSVEDKLESGLAFFDTSIEDLDVFGNVKSKPKQTLRADKFEMDGNHARESTITTENSASRAFRAEKEETEELQSVSSSDEGAVDDFASAQAEHEIFVLEKKVEVYRGHLKTLKEKVKTMKSKKIAAEEKNAQLKQLVDTQEIELEELKAELDNERTNKKFRFGATGGANRDATLERQKQRQEAMRQMMSGAAEMDTEDDTFLQSGNAVDATLKRFRMILERVYPLTNDLKQIEARHGHSVASYFKFFRWMIVNYIFMSIPVLISLIRHMITLSANNYNTWTKMNGFLPYFGIFPSYVKSEALEYTFLLCSIGFILLIVTIQKWISEDRTLKMIDALEEGSGNKFKFSRVSINAWDFYIKTEDQADDMRKSVAEQIRVAIHENSAEEQKNERSKKERYILYFRRFCGTVLYISLQAGGWFVIIMLTTQASKFEELLAKHYPFLSSYAASIVPAGVTIINSALPALISAITKLEKWDDAGFAIKAMVTRLFTAKIMNIMIQLFSFGLLLNPYYFTTSNLFFVSKEFTVRENVKKPFNANSYQCRAEQVALGLFTLVSTEFIISKIIAVSVPLAQRTVAQLRKKPFVKGEFIVAQKMVGLLYFQTLLYMVFPLSPFTVLSSFLMLLANFKYEKWILMGFQRKPMVPWNAKDAGNFFIKFFFFTVLLFVGAMHIMLLNKTLPKDCANQDTLADGSHMCMPNTYNPKTNLCVLNTSHPQSEYFKGDSCKEGYPACVCSGKLACGPFTSYVNGYAPLEAYLGSIQLIGVLFELATSSVISVWCLLLVIILLFFFRRNSLNVLRFSSNEQEQLLLGEVEALRRKLAVQDRQLKMHQNLS